MTAPRQYVSAKTWERTRASRDRYQEQAKGLRAKVATRDRMIEKLKAEHAAERLTWAAEKLELQRAIVRMRGVAAAWKLKAEGRAA